MQCASFQLHRCDRNKDQSCDKQNLYKWNWLSYQQRVHTWHIQFLSKCDCSFDRTESPWPDVRIMDVQQMQRRKMVRIYGKQRHSKCSFSNQLQVPQRQRCGWHVHTFQRSLHPLQWVSWCKYHAKECPCMRLRYSMLQKSTPTGIKASLLVCGLRDIVSKATATWACAAPVHHLGHRRLLCHDVHHLSAGQFNVHHGNRLLQEPRLGRWIAFSISFQCQG